MKREVYDRLLAENANLNPDIFGPRQFIEDVFSKLSPFQVDARQKLYEGKSSHPDALDRLVNNAKDLIEPRAA